MAVVRSGKLRVGVVGAGGMGKTHMRSWMELKDEAEVIAVCDIDRQRADDRAREFDLPRAVYHVRELLALKPDIIDVIVPNCAHHEVTVAALTGGCHTICEKPLALSVRQVRSMTSAAERSGRLLMVAHNQRFVPGHQALKRVIEAGELGEIYHVHTQWLRRRAAPVRPSYYTQAQSGGGPVIDLACHALDLNMWLTGNFRPVSVCGLTACKLAKRKGIIGLWGRWDTEAFDVEDFGAAMIRFANGAVMIVEVSWASNIVEEEIQRSILLGTEGGASLPDMKLSFERHGSLIDGQLVHVPKPSSYVEELRAFCQAVREGRPSPIPADQSLQVIAVLEAWYRSQRLGREVPVSSTARARAVAKQP